MVRGFEKISWHQFQTDVADDYELYCYYNLPSKATKASAGYDMMILHDLLLHPGEIKKTPTGIKAYMQTNEALFLIIRSSLGVKHKLRLCNQVGIVDADYYNNETNEGHIWVVLQNFGSETVEIARYETVAQGIFMPILAAENVAEPKQVRKGGIGSTDEKK